MGPVAPLAVQVAPAGAVQVAPELELLEQPIPVVAVGAVLTMLLVAQGDPA